MKGLVKFFQRRQFRKTTVVDSTIVSGVMELRHVNLYTIKAANRTIQMH